MTTIKITAEFGGTKWVGELTEQVPPASKSLSIKDCELNAEYGKQCWSPDGTRLAVLSRNEQYPDHSDDRLQWNIVHVGIGDTELKRARPRGNWPWYDWSGRTPVHHQSAPGDFSTKWVNGLTTEVLDFESGILWQVDPGLDLGFFHEIQRWSGGYLLVSSKNQDIYLRSTLDGSRIDPVEGPTHRWSHGTIVTLDGKPTRMMLCAAVEGAMTNWVISVDLANETPEQFPIVSFDEMSEDYGKEVRHLQNQWVGNTLGMSVICSESTATHHEVGIMIDDKAGNVRAVEKGIMVPKNEFWKHRPDFSISPDETSIAYNMYGNVEVRSL